MFRAGHCICREYHKGPDEHAHVEGEEHTDDTWVKTCSNHSGVFEFVVRKKLNYLHTYLYL